MFSNQPTVLSSSGSELETQRFKSHVLPSWIYEAFTRKYSLGEIHDYAKLRKVLSLEDIAHLEIYAERFTLSTSVDIGWLDSVIEARRATGADARLTSKEASELSSTIDVLMQDQHVVEEAMGRLKALPKNSSDCFSVGLGFPDKVNDEEVPPYKVVTLQHSLYIIVEEGFLSRIGGKAARLAFLTQVLKAAYSISTIKVVHQTEWYRQYVQALKA